MGSGDSNDRIVAQGVVCETDGMSLAERRWDWIGRRRTNPESRASDTMCTRHRDAEAKRPCDEPSPCRRGSVRRRRSALSRTRWP